MQGTMLARTVRPSIVFRSTRFYSSNHGHNSGDHHSSEHHSSEHHDEHHDHHDHGPPLSESESILNSKTAIAAGIVFSIASYSYLNNQYKESHNGDSITSIVSSKHNFDQLKENYNSYRNRVSLQKEIQEMMMFPSTEKRNYNNLITSIDTVPGRLFPTGSNSQFNTIQDYSKLDNRKVKSSPFI